AGGAQAAAEDFDAKVEVLMPEVEEDVPSQTRLLLSLDPKSLDGAAVSPLDAQTQSGVINRLSLESLIITVDSDAPQSNRMSYVGASNYAAGKQCGQLVQEALPDGGKVVLLLANLTKDNMIERKRGIEDEFAELKESARESGADYEIAEVLLDEGDLKKCQQQLTDLLKSRDDIGCVVGMNGYDASIMVKCAEAAERSGDVKLIGFDAIDDTLDLVADGRIYATVAQDPYQYGYHAVRVLCDYCRRREGYLPLTGVRSTLNIQTKPIRKDNVEEFRESSQKQLKKLTA
ncbi:MAG: substrate-binding domain-containing protein, partial [Planctomycetales bacterium]|nr:substrate-binding domain-containing protein [Planctomycetales bacterium]